MITAPAHPDPAKAALAAAYAARREEIHALARALHADPETAFEEHRAPRVPDRDPGAGGRSRHRLRRTRPMTCADVYRLGGGGLQGSGK